MIKANHTVDAQGLSCPMPIVKARKGMDEINAGEILEVLATDIGSITDIEAWAKSTGHDYLGIVEEGLLLKHYIRKENKKEATDITQHTETISNDLLTEKLPGNPQLIDVREQAEYAFGHIPGAISIPLGELEGRINELDKSKELYIVCRSGNRSDMACRMLSAQGFANTVNVIPGMMAWVGTVEKR